MGAYLAGKAADASAQGRLTARRWRARPEHAVGVVGPRSLSTSSAID